MELLLTEESITSRTRAIRAPHLYGHPVDMTGMVAIAERHGLALIEDGSQAHGSVHRGTVSARSVTRRPSQRTE